MMTAYSNRHLRQADRVDTEPVRVRRPWRGVTKGQVLTNLPASKRRQLLRSGFVETIEAETKKKTTKKKTP